MKTNNVVIFHPSNSEEMNALKAIAKALKMKFEVVSEKEYSLDFVKKMEAGKKDVKSGNVTKITVDELKRLWK